MLKSSRFIDYYVILVRNLSANSYLISSTWMWLFEWLDEVVFLVIFFSCYFDFVMKRHHFNFPSIVDAMLLFQFFLFIDLRILYKLTSLLDLSCKKLWTSLVRVIGSLRYTISLFLILKYDLKTWVSLKSKNIFLLRNSTRKWNSFIILR